MSSNDTYSISIPNVGVSTSGTYVYSAGGGGGSGSWSSTGYSSSVISTGTISPGVGTSATITIRGNDGKYIDVGKSIEKIMDILGIVIPDPAMLEKYPALKNAHDEYEVQLKKAYANMNPDLKVALDGYKTMEALVNEDS